MMEGSGPPAASAATGGRALDARWIEAQDWAGEDAKKRVHVIIERCAHRYGVSVADILGRGRMRALVTARHEAIQIVSRVFPRFSTPHLGRLFNRDHTSILYALGRTTRGARKEAQ